MKLPGAHPYPAIAYSTKQRVQCREMRVGDAHASTQVQRKNKRKKQDPRDHRSPAIIAGGSPESHFKDPGASPLYELTA